jgi:hypothetical protein
MHPKGMFDQQCACKLTDDPVKTRFVGKVTSTEVPNPAGKPVQQANPSSRQTRSAGKPVQEANDAQR